MKNNKKWNYWFSSFIHGYMKNVLFYTFAILLIIEAVLIIMAKTLGWFDELRNTQTKVTIIVTYLLVPLAVFWVYIRRLDKSTDYNDIEITIQNGEVTEDFLIFLGLDKIKIFILERKMIKKRNLLSLMLKRHYLKIKTFQNSRIR